MIRHILFSDSSKLYLSNLFSWPFVYTEENVCIIREKLVNFSSCWLSTAIRIKRYPPPPFKLKVAWIYVSWSMLKWLNAYNGLIIAYTFISKQLNIVLQKKILWYSAVYILCRNPLVLMVIGIISNYIINVSSLWRL